MRKKIRSWIAGLSAIFLLISTIVIMVVVPRYKPFYLGLGATPPTLTRWVLIAYPYTLLVLLWMIPLYLLYKSPPDALGRHVGLTAATGIILILFVCWLGVLWFGIYFPIHVMNNVVGTG